MSILEASRLSRQFVTRRPLFGAPTVVRAVDEVSLAISAGETFDIWVMLMATALLLVFAWTGQRLTRIEGGIFLLAYAAYVGFLASSAA